MVVHICNPRTLKPEAGRSRVRGQRRLVNEKLSLKIIKKNFGWGWWSGSSDKVPV
jgi:hypothetical protein